MTAVSVQNMRNERGHGGGLFAGRRKTVESVKMKTKAVPIFGIATVVSQQNTCPTFLTSVSYAK